MRIRRLPRHRGPAGWNSLLPPAAPAQPLEGAAVADLLIIGGGFAGLAAARRARQLDPNARILLLEAGRIAQGAGGRNSGFMIDLPHELTSDNYVGAGDDRLQIALNRQAIAFAREAVADYSLPAAYFDPAGKINGAGGAAAEAHNRQFAAHLDQLGERYDWLDAQAMHQITGSRYYRSGLFTPGTVMLQPAGFVRGMAAGLARDGLLLHENSPVRLLSRETGGWRAETPQGSVSAGRVILTVNGHLESFGFARGRLIQLFLFAMISPELDAATRQRLGGQPRWGITPADPMGTTVRRIDAALGGERIVTRSWAALRPGLQSSASDIARARRVMQRKFDRRFPQLAGLAPAQVWAGHLCLAQNAVSVVGELDQRLFAGCVQNGLGTVRGTLTGIAAAEQACGAPTSEIQAHFAAQPAPSRLPPALISQPAGNALLRWRSWRAGSE